MFCPLPVDVYYETEEFSYPSQRRLKTIITFGSNCFLSGHYSPPRELGMPESEHESR